MLRGSLFIGLSGSLLLSSCLLPEDAGITSTPRMVARQVQANSNRLNSSIQDGGKFVVEYQHSDVQGRSLPCEDMGLSVTVEYAPGGVTGSFVPLESTKVRVSCEKDEPLYLGIVVDNSGSQGEELSEIQAGAKNLARDVIRRGGKVSLTRVSTQAKNLVALTDNLESINQALEATQVKKGWTALYDGIRMASEALGKEVIAESSQNGNSSCRRGQRTAIAVFTDGADNNSADENNDKESDGFATNIEDLMGLSHLGVKVPVFGIGMGKDVNQQVLESLASASGGVHLAIENHHAVGEAFGRISDALRESVEVCADLPVTCGEVGVRVTYSYTLNGEQVTSQETYSTEVECPAPPPKGRVATILMALSDPSLSPDFARKLVKNTADWSATGREKRVLLVLDDNGIRESRGEVPFLQDALLASGYQVEAIKERKRGLVPADLKGYDLVWFTNPGYPMNDRRSFKTLRKHVAEGNALIFSGDDMAHATGNGFSLSRLTRMTYVDNGIYACRLRTDNGSRNGYALHVGDFSHAITDGLSFNDVVYRNDIDHTWPLFPTKEVLMWGKVQDGKGCSMQTPVVTARIFE